MKATRIGLLTLATLAAPLTAAAQAACSRVERPVIRVGFNIECHCTLVHNEGAAERWIFQTEPEVFQADDGSAMRVGDVIVKANGVPITTDAGGAAFSLLYTGRPVVLGVRRGSLLALVRVVPTRECEPRDAARRAAPDTGRFTGGGLVTRGYLGLGLATRATVQAPPDGPPVWHFEEPPVVVGLAEGGPAQQAGLRIGDSVTAVDGHPIVSDEAGRRFGAALPGETLRLEVKRGRATLRLPVDVAHREAAPVRLSGRRVEVTGPAHLERVGDRIVIRADSGSVTVIISP